MTSLPGSLVEIKQIIFNYLVESPEPTIAFLCRTHRAFWNSISPADVCNKPSNDALVQQLRTAEGRYPYVLPPAC